MYSSVRTVSYVETEPTWDRDATFTSIMVNSTCLRMRIDHHDAIIYIGASTHQTT
jgi:hypothetical protein